MNLSILLCADILEPDPKHTRQADLMRTTGDST